VRKKVKKKRNNFFYKRGKERAKKKKKGFFHPAKWRIRGGGGRSGSGTTGIIQIPFSPLIPEPVTGQYIPLGGEKERKRDGNKEIAEHRSVMGGGGNLGHDNLYSFPPVAHEKCILGII